MINRIKKALLYSGLEKEEYKSLQNDLIRMNYSSLKILTLITAGVMVLMLVLSYQGKNWSADRGCYIACLCISVLIFAVTYLGILKSERAVLAVVYMYLASIFLYGIVIGNTQPAMTSVYFLIYIMVGPLMFYDRPIKLNIFIWIFNILFIVSSLRVKTPEAGNTDLVNGIAYGIVSIFLNTSAINHKIRRVWLEKQMTIMAETDKLTKLKNRNCFEHCCRKYAKMARKNVTCIYIDANGLHEINNIKGHEAGDEMLKYLAEQTMLLFGEEDSYRIGGDEYMVICCDQDLEIIRQQIEELSERLEERNYSASVGVVNVSAAELNIDELMKKADEEMYLAKKKYYEWKGIERRRRRA